MDDQTFRRLFRFEKGDLHMLKDALRITEIRSSQGVTVSAEEALLMGLRRLAYPNRWWDLEPLFGRHASAMSSIVSVLFNHIDSSFGHLLDDLNNHSWLRLSDLEDFSKAVYDRGTPLRNCWGFVDGTARPICRPSVNQRVYFSGHKRHHALKYQAVMCANGIVCQLDGPYEGHRHDAGILRDSGLYEKLERLVQGNSYCIYGDPAYPLRPLLMRPYAGAALTRQQELFNKQMSTVRQAVEWGFGKTVAEFSFLDFKKNQKLMLQNLGQMYRVGTLLANCHTCIYGSQTGMFFGIRAPELHEYLGV
ncbi:uncharacterized protein LOC142574599 [Dermacentor variabilis]|uniref:uncharacterized protein LOC142574599 n=1 Tax=Dermacentor variabilis TaxID=34621 RepID=UPI003F5C177B